MSLDVECLARLQLQHLKHIPFQNLGYFEKGASWIDFHNPMTLIESVLKKEGGLCFHLNYSFSQLLHNLGFECYLIGCWMNRSDTDHMAIIVRLGDVNYLVDVGYGEPLLREPMPIIDGFHQSALGLNYRLRLIDGRWFLQKKMGEWKTVYHFELSPRELAEFKETYIAHLTQSSGFRRSVFFSRASNNGFVRLVNNQIRIHLHDKVLKRKLSLDESGTVCY